MQARQAVAEAFAPPQKKRKTPIKKVKVANAGPSRRSTRNAGSSVNYKENEEPAADSPGKDGGADELASGADP